MQPKLLVALAAALFCAAAIHAAHAADWLTAPSYYTHDRASGERVAQYTPIGPFYYYQRADYSRSGYRNYRSTIQAGGSADNMHIVEEWGRPVIPYEQWRFPFRPYGTPYQNWGPPFGGLGGGNGGFYGPNGPVALPGFGGGGFGGGGNGLVVPQNQMPQQWIDGYYPTYDSNDRSHYYDPYPRP